MGFPDTLRGFSFYGRDFVRRGEAGFGAPRRTEEERRRVVDDITAQLVPRIGSGEYVLRQASRTVATVGLPCLPEEFCG